MAEPIELQPLVSPEYLSERDFLKLLTTETDFEIQQALIKDRHARLVDLSQEDKAEEMPLWMIAIGRIPAICITIILELVVGVVISRCQHIMRAHILMASFLPLLSSIAGNVGILSSTNTMRVLALGARVTSVVRKEFICAIFLSLVGGVMLFCVAFIWSNSGAFALATSLAVALNCTLAGLIGTVGPLTFRRLGLDYGFMAGPFETAFQDLLGTTIYFSLMLLLG